MKTSELTGVALDWAVAKCETYPMGIWYDEEELPMIRDDEVPEWKPSTNWAQGGPIIEREFIQLGGGITNNEPRWFAIRVKDDKSGACKGHGPTPLIAAMRCYVASKLGDEVEIPEELK
jgi:hypothetical protein